jgi:hypothetical protein
MEEKFSEIFVNINGVSSMNTRSTRHFSCLQNLDACVTYISMLDSCNTNKTIEGTKVSDINFTFDHVPSNDFISDLPFAYLEREKANGHEGATSVRPFRPTHLT